MSDGVIDQLSEGQTTRDPVQAGDASDGFSAHDLDAARYGDDRVYDALPEPVREYLDSMSQFQETIVEDTHDRTLDQLATLASDWDAYDQDLYHGTRSESLDQIIEDGGLIPGDQADAETGEVGLNGYVSTTSNVPVATFYAEKATPTPEQAQDAVDQHLDTILSYSGPAPDLSTESGQERFRSMMAVYEDHFTDESDMSMTGKLLSGLADRVDSLDDTGDPVVFGIDADGLDEDVPDHITEADDEFENAANDNHLAEYKVDTVPLEAMQAYVPHHKVDEYEQEYGDDIEVRSLTALKRRHELELRDRYEHEGERIELRSVWDQDGHGVLQVEPDRETYEGNPYRIEISG